MSNDYVEVISADGSSTIEEEWKDAFDKAHCNHCDSEISPYKNLAVDMKDGVMRVEVQCSPVIPVDCIAIDISAD